MKSAISDSPGPRILVVRLGAMGDIVHTLPAVASLKHGFPESHLTWVVEPLWAPLLEGNPFVDHVVTIERGSAQAWIGRLRELGAAKFNFAVDFQGLIKSAAVASLARPEQIFGFHQSQARERAAALFYSEKALSHATHIVDRNLDLAAAAGARSVVRAFPLPPGRAEGSLPEGAFVLASPLAGWAAKQWPLEYYTALAERLRAADLALVLNVAPGVRLNVPGAIEHSSGIAGLIHATRRATAVVGLDSGPLHIAAAVGKPGVAIYGPTDPARNGPYGDSITVLRSPNVVTTHKRRVTIHPSMREIGPDEVCQALLARIAGTLPGLQPGAAEGRLRSGLAAPRL